MTSARDLLTTGAGAVAALAGITRHGIGGPAPAGGFRSVAARRPFAVRRGRS